MKSLNSTFSFVFTAMIAAMLSQPLEASLPFFLKGPHRVAVGAEVYHSRRLKDGGSEQTGTPVGWYASYNRIRRNALYWGVDGRMAWGGMYGHSGSGRPLVSDLMDSEVEGRFGYTFQRTKGTRDALSLFIGYGYFNGTNKFRNPSPLPLHYRDYFTYYVVGFLASATFTPHFRLGANFKIQFMNDGKSEVTNDPYAPDVTLKMENKPQYQAEIPLTYITRDRYTHFEISLVPFLRYRHYGGRENYPYDFIETKFQMFGGRLEAAYVF